MMQLVVGFLPWIIFAVLGNRFFLLALVLALAAAAVATGRQLLSHSLKILDTVTLTFFVFVAVGIFGFRCMITAAWGLDFLLSALVSLYRHATGDRGIMSQYAWVVFSVLAALFTVRFPAWYRARALGQVGLRTG